MRKFINIINEYQKINAFNFIPYGFEDAGNPIGKINATGLVFYIYKIIDDNHISYGAIERSRTPDPSSPKATLVFSKMSGNAMILKNAWVDPSFQKRGIASEMLNFILWFENVAVLSDTQMTQAGINLCKSMIKSTKVSLQIYNARNHHIYELSDIGVVIDGVEVLDPKEDHGDLKLWDESTETGQQWFYVMQKKDHESMIEGQVHISQPSASFNLDLSYVLTPYGFFDLGDE